jgi:hypothetical protein
LFHDTLTVSDPTEVLYVMAVFVCKGCGAVKEGRCKPKKCECGAEGQYEKVEEKK